MDRVCEVCGGPLRKGNIYGVCWRNKACIKENKRREYQRMSGQRRNKMNEYAKTDEGQIENRRKYRLRLRREHPLYTVWQSMKQRCLNPNSPAYADYGGRGITVYERWKTFANFETDVLSEIGPRPPGKYENGNSLYQFDRINNDGNYEPGNIRWATVAVNSNNRRTSIAQLTALREEVVRLRAENEELRTRLGSLFVP